MDKGSSYLPTNQVKVVNGSVEETPALRWDLKHTAGVVGVTGHFVEETPALWGNLKRRGDPSLRSG